jgi:hypothetical protein
MKSFDSKSVLVVLGGVPITGFAEGSRIVCTPNAKRYTKKVGSDGEVTVSKTNNKAYTFKLVLARTSLSNTYLSSLVNTDDVTPGGVSHPFLVQDLISGSTYTSKNVKIAGFPEDSIEAEATDLEWEIEAGETLVQINGVASQEPAAE